MNKIEELVLRAMGAVPDLTGDVEKLVKDAILTAVKYEREECAKLVEEWSEVNDCHDIESPWDLVDKIRARGSE